MKSLAVMLLVLSLTWLTGTAWARPGGGQSFSGGSRSGGGSSGGSGYSGGSSDRSGGGSSFSGGSSNRSGGGSSWSWGAGGSSKSSSSDSPSTPTYSPSAEELERRQREVERMQDEVSCMQQCLGSMHLDPSNRTTCENDCYAKKRKERDEQARLREEQRRRDAVAERHAREERSMTARLFPVVLGGGFLGLLGFVAFMRRRKDQAWASGVISDQDIARVRSASLPPTPAAIDDRPRFPSVNAAIAALKAKDESFSFVLFEDFAHALYVEAHTARGRRELARLAPYLSDDARLVLSNQVVDGVSTIVVGAMRIEDVRADTTARKIEARVRFTANYTERSAGADQSYYVEEVWTFTRGADVVSRPPERSRVIDCPSCGAPLDKIVGGTCRYCDTAPGAGRQDWFVSSIRVEAREPRGPMLTGTTEEVGTDLPTVVAPDVKQKYAALVARDPALDWRSFTKRVDAIFYRFHETWSAQELGGVRPFLSDNLYEAQGYWVAAYQAAGLRNVSEEPKILVTQLARVTSDKFFDAITVRIYAQCLDYTIDKGGKVVGGNRSKPRQYSEYWTLIRGAGATGSPRSEDTCPNCGADASHVNMAGICGSCSVKITSGAFDWVLSRIEQDEVYET
jgi:predicted lipid-binding transport protein (Tim44 family)